MLYLFTYNIYLGDVMFCLLNIKNTSKKMFKVKGRFLYRAVFENKVHSISVRFKKIN